MIITLPDEMRESLEARAKAAGYESVDEFVEDRVDEEPEPPTVVGTPGWIDANRKVLLALAEQGMKSPPIDDPERFLAELLRRTKAGEPLEDLRP